MKKALEQIHFPDKNDFRQWLMHNRDRRDGIWMIFYKKHVNRRCITYREALEEALCYGWIDSIIKRLDEDRYVRKFTPRTNTSNWSDVNKQIVHELIKSGRMTEAGLNKIDVYMKTGKVDWEKAKKSSPKALVVPDYVLDALSKNEPALTNFNQLAPSHKRQYIGWITSAKKDETRKKRLSEAIVLLQRNETLGLR